MEAQFGTLTWPPGRTGKGPKLCGKVDEPFEMEEGSKWRTTRCRKCRHNLGLEQSIDTRCMLSTDSVLYVTVDNMPDWVLTQINKANWTKGKVICEKCGGRLGSFDFTNIKLCQVCREHDVSAVHVQRNRVDLMKPMGTSVGFTSRSMHGATQRQQADPTTKTDSGTLFNDSQNRQEINSREANLSQTQLPNHDDAASVRMNKSNNCKNSAEEMVMVPKRISPLITNRGSNQASIDDGFIRRGDNPTLVSDDIDDVNPFTVLSEHDQDSSVDDGDDDEEEVGVACFKGRKRKRVETPETFEVLEVPETTFPDEYCCAICMDLYYRPHTCKPCNHVFCEACLRRLARERPSLTPCPYCRNVIMECNFDPDLDFKLKTEYPEIYKSRRHNLRKIDSQFYQLPRCSRTQYQQYQLRNYYANRNIVNRNNVIVNLLYRFLPFLATILIFTVLPCLLIYYLFTLVYEWIISLDSYVGDWSLDSWHFENANFFIYNCFKLAIHGCSWYNLYHQAMQYQHWYQYIVFFMQFWSVIQMNLFRCVICTLSAEFLSRFFIQRQARERRQQ